MILHDFNNDLVYINLKKVEYMKPGEFNGTMIAIGGEHIYVKESLEEILRRKSEINNC